MAAFNSLSGILAQPKIKKPMNATDAEMKIEQVLINHLSVEIIDFI